MTQLLVKVEIIVNHLISYYLYIMKLLSLFTLINAGHLRVSYLKPQLSIIFQAADKHHYGHSQAPMSHKDAAAVRSA